MSSDFLSKKFGWRRGWETGGNRGSVRIRGSQCARESLEMLVCGRERPWGVVGVILPGCLSEQAGKLESALQSPEGAHRLWEKVLLHFERTYLLLHEETQAPKVKWPGAWSLSFPAAGVSGRSSPHVPSGPQLPVLQTNSSLLHQKALPSRFWRVGRASSVRGRGVILRAALPFPQHARG